MTIKTARMTLIPTTAALARVEIADRPAFAARLGASVPEAWPPETLRDALAFFLQQIEAAPEQAAWITWYSAAVGALIGWALAQAGVRRIIANVAAGNTPSIRLLCRLGFSERGASEEPGHLRFERSAALVDGNAEETA